MEPTTESAYSQTAFLNPLCGPDVQTLVTLRNGKKLSGSLEAFDAHTILFTPRHGRHSGRLYMIYKHAIDSVARLPRSAPDLERRKEAAPTQ